MNLHATFNKLVFEIEVFEEGIYLNIYAANGVPVSDYEQASIEEAKVFALDEYGVPLDSWGLSGLK